MENRESYISEVREAVSISVCLKIFMLYYATMLGVDLFKNSEEVSLKASCFITVTSSHFENDGLAKCCCPRQAGRP